MVLSDDTTHTKSQIVKGGLPLTARWMPQVTSFCFSKINSHAGFAGAKGGGQGEQLVHLFRLVEQTMAVLELVTFPGLVQGAELLI